jgi:hypothetical protein
MKICSKCKNEKEESEFFFKNKEKNILHSCCKECKREIDKISYNENKNNRKVKVRKLANENIIKVRNFFVEYKKTKKCEICGESRWYVLDFHHIKEKKYEIADLVKRGCSLKTLIEELKKCIPVCANCHREIHYNEKLVS